MLKSRLWDYSHEYILASRAITINGAEDDDNAKRSGSLWQYYWDDWFGNIDSYGNIQINHSN